MLYVNDILLIRSDVDGSEKAKKYLKTQFVTKIIWTPRYFLVIDIAHSKYEVVLSQQKYTLDLL